MNGVYLHLANCLHIVHRDKLTSTFSNPTPYCITLLEVLMVAHLVINPLTPNDSYAGRSAPLTSKVALYIFIQQI